MKDYPVIKFSLFFIAGISLQPYLPVSANLNMILLVMFLFLFAVIYLFEKGKSVPIVSSVLLLLIVSLIGYTSKNIQQKSRNFLPDSVYVAKNLSAYGVVESIDLPGGEGFSFLLRTDSISIKSTLRTHINLLCKLYDTSSVKILNELRPGNIIKITGTYKKGREERNPGEFNYNKYLHLKNISGTVFVYESNDITILDNRTNFFKNAVFSVRKTLNHIIGGLHTKETTALLKGLLLADRNDISFDTKTQFINAGVVHILAVSGLHVGFIALIFYALLGRLNIYLRSVLTITGILLFMFITGVPASVFRASVMAVVIIIAFLSNRKANIYNSLAIAALLILSVNPSEFFSPGFRLSFSAVLSIAYFYPIIRRAILKAGIRNIALKNILLFCAVSVSAQIGTLPFTLNYFGKFSLVAILANLVVIPLVGVIIGTAIVTVSLFPLSIWAASVYASANNLFSHFLFVIVRFAGNLKYAFIDIRNYSSTDALIFYIFVLGGIFLIRYLSSVRAKVIFILLIGANIGLYSTLDNSELLAENKLNIYMIDVGQGDSFLIKFPDNETALIDAGEATPFFDNGERTILPLLNKLGINKIDYGFVSHIDADHYSGFVSLIQRDKIKKIYKPPLDSESEKDLRFEKFLGVKGIPTEYYSKKEIKIGNALIFILNDSLYESDPSLTSNGRSGIFKIDYGNTSFLFTGDLETKGEMYYLNKYGNFLNINVLKVGHHGSKSGSSQRFISITSPEISLVSCGIKNKYGHPAEEVIDRLSRSNSLIYRTDNQGGVLLWSGGYKVYKIDWKNNY
jgi:competence protein ComEC